jgi:hypothetical protein
VSIPARVERYDAVKQLIDAQPLIKQARQDEEGTRVVESLPVISNVPLVFPGSGAYRITFPVSQGDTVLLVFSESALDTWLSQGGLVDPIDDNRFSLKDAIAIPGLRDFATPLQDAPTDRMTLGHDQGAQIHIDQNEIRLGANTGVQFVALANLVLDRLNQIATAHDIHTHPTAPTGPISTPSSLVGVVSPVASSNTKAKE